MTVADLSTVVRLWAGMPGVGLNEMDELGPLEAYLRRNPGLSLVAFYGEELVGAVLCGYDGRRGYLDHLAVVPTFRSRGLGRSLVRRRSTELATLGILRCNIFLYVDNEPGRCFWQRCNWAPRSDLQTWQRSTKPTVDEAAQTSTAS
ncbi:MAG: GNAT family N-acetyltransferase [Pirellulales bacterium]